MSNGFQKFMPWTRQYWGNVADVWGTAMNAPEWGVSEAVAKEPTAFTGRVPSQQQITAGQQARATTPEQDQLAAQQFREQTMRGAADAAGPSPQPTGLITPGTQGPTASASEQDKAAEILRLMNEGKITWDDNLRSWANNMLKGGGDPYSEAIEAMYAPAARYLEELETQYGTELAPAEEALRTSHQEALIPVEERQAAQEAIIGEQTGEVGKEKESALGASRRLYDELRQGVISRFGAGISTGPAAMEILGGETARRIGGIEETATTALGKLSDESRRLTDFVGRQKEVLANKLKDATEALRVEFRRGLMQIRAMRAQPEIEKARARLETMQRYQEQAFQIEQADKAFQRQLTLFEATKSDQLAQQYQANTGISSAAALAFQRLVGGGYPTGAAAEVTGLPTTLDGAGIQFKQTVGQWEYIPDQDYWINRSTGEISRQDPSGGGAGGGSTFGIPGLFGGAG